MSALSCNQLKRRCEARNVKQSPIILPENIKISRNNIDLIIGADNLYKVKTLGEGSFSSVFLMKDKVKGVNFAVKIFENLDEESIKLIKSDIDIGNSVYSRFKIHYYGAIQDKHSIWIVMEPMDLSVSDFYTALLGKDPNYHLPSRVIGYLAYCSIYGLEDLHNNQIIHRDIKPSNMLIDRDGNFKLCDFGISRRMKDSIAKSAVGTRAYLAPERIDPQFANQPYTIKSDIWSLGLSMMELALMRFPFGTGLLMMEQLNAIVKKPPPRLPESSPYFGDAAMVEFFECTIIGDIDKRQRYHELKTLKFISQFDPEGAFNEAKKELSDLVIQLGLQTL